MNESKRGKKAAAENEKINKAPAKKEVNEDAKKGRDFTNAEIAVALEQTVDLPKQPKPVREIKAPQPRKFKTHSEKKAAALAKTDVTIKPAATKKRKVAKPENKKAIALKKAKTDSIGKK